MTMEKPIMVSSCAREVVQDKFMRIFLKRLPNGSLFLFFEYRHRIFRNFCSSYFFMLIKMSSAWFL